LGRFEKNSRQQQKTEREEGGSQKKHDLGRKMREKVKKSFVFGKGPPHNLSTKLGKKIIGRG